MNFEAIQEKEKHDKYQKELKRAQKAVEEIKRLRIDEGPEE